MGSNIPCVTKHIIAGNSNLTQTFPDMSHVFGHVTVNILQNDISSVH